MVNIFLFLDILSTIFIFFFGYYIFLKDSKRDANRFFFLFSLTLTIIAISSAGLRAIGFKPGLPGEKAIEMVPKEKFLLFCLFNQIGWIGIAFIASIFCHLVLIVFEKKKFLKEKKHYIFYFLSLLFFLWTLPYYSQTFTERKNLIYQLFYILFSIYFISTFFISFILLVREYFFLKSPREKIKIGYFIIGFLIPFFGTIILDVLLPLIKFGEFAGITYSLYFVTFGYFFIGIGVLGYGLFIDYREVLEKIFRGLTEMVIITDREGTILMTNEITLSKFNYKKEEFIGKKIEESIKGGREEFKEISKKLKRFGDVFEKRLYFLTKARKPIPFLSSISLTKEGIIFVGQDIKEILSYQEKLKREIREKTAQLEEAKSILEIKVAARKKELADLTQSLEERVRQKTKELRERIEELEKFQKLLRGRELKMVELEKEIERLKGELAKKRIKNE